MEIKTLYTISIVDKNSISQGSTIFFEYCSYNYKNELTLNLYYEILEKLYDHMDSDRFEFNKFFGLLLHSYKIKS